MDKGRAHRSPYSALWPERIDYRIGTIKFGQIFCKVGQIFKNRRLKFGFHISGLIFKMMSIK